MRRRPRKQLQDEDAIKDSSVCKLCREGPDEALFGKFFVDERSGFSVHQYCMFFASGLAQRGEDDEGFDGFLIADIKKEIARSKRLRCNFCKRTGAAIGCCYMRCHQTFHYKCARQRGALFQFFDSFNSFCPDHRPTQRAKLALSASQPCPICWCPIEWNSKMPFSDIPLVTPCCKMTWFHNSCLQSHAQSSGMYYFRCPVCNNMEQFQAEMKRMGIFIPEQDASWEKDNAFADLLFQYSRCDAKKCICPNGREHKEAAGGWRIRLCDVCGQQGTHLKCQHWKKSPGEWHCDVCGSIAPYSGTRKRPIGDRSMDLSHSEDDEESSSAEDLDVNVCSVSDDEISLAAIRNSITSARQTTVYESTTEKHVREGGSPMRKRRRLSLERTGAETSHLEGCTKTSQNTATCSGLQFYDNILDSTSMTPNVLLAISDTVFGGGKVTSQESADVTTVQQTVQKEGETILIDSDSASDASIEWVKSEFKSDLTDLKRKPIVRREKSTEDDTCSESSELSSVASNKSPGKGKQNLFSSTRKRRIDAAEADSSSVSVKVGETASAQANLPVLDNKQKFVDSDDDACVITKVLKMQPPSCPYGNDKNGMTCILHCCPCNSKTVSSTVTSNNCDYLKEKSSKATEQNLPIDTASTVAEDEQKSDVCSVGTNTLPFKSSPRKKLSARQTSTTQTFFPKEERLTSGQKKRLNLRRKKSASYLDATKNVAINNVVR